MNFESKERKETRESHKATGKFFSRNFSDQERMWWYTQNTERKKKKKKKLSSKETYPFRKSSNLERNNLNCLFKNTEHIIRKFIQEILKPIITA